MNDKPIIYKGDIIIIKDKTSISNEENRGVLQEGVPYFVDDTSSSGSLYIKIYGKEITIFSSDYQYIEHIKIVERGTYQLGEHVMILDDEKVQGALELGFREGLGFEVVKIIGNEIIISNGKNELWIRETELSFIKSTTKQTSKENDAVIDKLEEKNIQNLIDKALDEKDFEKLKTLNKYVKFDASKTQ